MSRLVVSVVIILTLSGVMGTLVHAQDTPTIYTVTSPQTVNARGCPRLTCPVLQTFAPGDQLAVIDVAHGEAVLGSDAWLHMNVDGVDLFVHSSLATPLAAPAAAPPPASGRDASEDSAPADSSSEGGASGATGDWVTHTGAGFALDIPPSWLEITDILTDEGYIDDLAEFLGQDADQTMEAMQTLCSAGACDLVMADLGGSAALFLLHLDMEGMPQSAKLWNILLAQQFKDQGADVISSEVVELPAGEAARIHLVLTMGVAQMEMEYVIYAVIGGDRMYMLLFYIDSCCVEDYITTIDQIAASFRIENETNIE
jgi:hypothetical protein